MKKRVGKPRMALRATKVIQDRRIRRRRTRATHREIVGEYAVALDAPREEEAR